MNTVTIQDFEQYRIAHKLTKKEMAPLIGVNYSFFVAVMRGRKLLTPRMILRFNALQDSPSTSEGVTYRDVIAIPVRLTDSEWQAVQARLGVSTVSEAEGVLRDYLIAQARQQVQASKG